MPFHFAWSWCSFTRNSHISFEAGIVAHEEPVGAAHRVIVGVVDDDQGLIGEARADQLQGAELVLE